ncbi:MAG: glycosyltransferase [Bacteroidota bacterium]
MDKKITLIYGFRNRDIQRVQRSLHSLSTQTKKEFNVIFLDYGSDESVSNEVKNILKNYSFEKYVYNDTRGMPWNRSHALNSGIQLSETNFVFTADIDMIFKNNFIEKLESLANDNTVTFFQVYYLPEKFSDWESMGSKTFEASKKFALGLALLPVKIINEIRGYDEFYCFWGMEDNDLEHRLKSTGVKTNFFDKEVLMYHQWHLPSILSDKEFPESWAVFQNDYFNSKAGIVKRNDDREWGKIFLENERQSVKMINDPLTKFKVMQRSTSFFTYELNRQFKNLISQETLCFEFNDVHSDTHLKSGLGKSISFFQKICDKIKIPVKLVSQYRHLFTTVYEIRDEAMLFILAHQAEISDYSISIFDKKLKLVIFKK